MHTPVLVWQGLRYGCSSLKRKMFGNRRFSGSANRICEQIVDACWNGRYFENSLGNYREFWMRDFGMATEALLRMGKKTQVRATLDYALSRFKSRGVHTAITRQGMCFNFPNLYSPDSVAWLFHALAKLGDKSLVRENEQFLVTAAEEFAHKVVGRDGNIAKGRFSGMRDYAIREQSCYDCAMVGLMSKSVDALRLHNPIRFDAKKALMKYWTGTHFKPDLSGARHITGDANIAPFFLDLPKSMMKQAFTMLEHDLVQPLPLKYSSVHEERMIMLEFLVPNWERETSWTHMGLLYLQLLKKVMPDVARSHKQKYARLIEEHGTLFELYDDRMKPYKSLGYYADEGMLWAANFL